MAVRARSDSHREANLVHRLEYEDLAEASG
jgi:hypothetical protein